MRVNLITQSSVASTPGKGAIPLSLTIRPAGRVPGDYQYLTDSAAILQMLRQHTDLPTTVLDRFKGDMCASIRAQLLGVELSERLLTDIGYFVD
jgi:glutathione S-transferase